MDTRFIRDRITELRLRKNVSEYKMSLELGQNKSYIQGISSGRALPSMGAFLDICDYLEITPASFFANKPPDPLLRALVNKAEQLSKEDLHLLNCLAERLLQEKTGTDE